MKMNVSGMVCIVFTSEIGIGVLPNAIRQMYLVR